jgi:hypothetical protein
MNRRVVLVGAVLGVVGGAACGGQVERDFDGHATEETASTGGAGGGGTGEASTSEAGSAADAAGQAAVGVKPVTASDAGGAAEAEPCSGYARWLGAFCHWWFVEVGSVAATAAGPPACAIPIIGFEPGRSAAFGVYLDCRSLRYCGDTESPTRTACFEFDNRENPPKVTLGPALCSRVENGGFDRIDIVQEVPIPTP